MLFKDLPPGVPCNISGFGYVFCRVREADKGDWTIFMLGEEEGVIEHISALFDKYATRNDFRILDCYRYTPTNS